MNDIEYLKNKNVIELIKLRVLIKEITINVRISSPDSRYYLFPSLYSEHLTLDNFLLKEEFNSKSYKHGVDACGHALKGSQDYTRRIYPYFEYNYLRDDGYFQNFSIFPNTTLENGLSFKEIIKNAPDILKYRLEQIGKAPSILDLTVLLVKKYPEFIKAIDFETNEDHPILDYLDQMHPNASDTDYSMLGISKFSNFEQARKFAKIFQPSEIIVESDFYLVKVIR